MYNRSRSSPVPLQSSILLSLSIYLSVPSVLSVVIVSVSTTQNTYISSFIFSFTPFLMLFHLFPAFKVNSLSHNHHKRCSLTY